MTQCCVNDERTVLNHSNFFTLPVCLTCLTREIPNNTDKSARAAASRMWDQWLSGKQSNNQQYPIFCNERNSTWSDLQFKQCPVFMSWQYQFILSIISSCMLKLQLGYGSFVVWEPSTPPTSRVVTDIILVLQRDSLTAMLLILCRSALNASFLVNLDVSPHILCKSPCGTGLHQNRFSPHFLSTAR